MNSDEGIIIVSVVMILVIINNAIFKYLYDKKYENLKRIDRKNVENEIELKYTEITENWKQTELQKQVETATKIKMDKWITDQTPLIRKDAIEKSKSVIAGKVSEQFIPFMPQFKYNSKDARFLGTPIDYVVFNGLDGENVSEIVFIECKNNRAGLSKKERSIRDCLAQGKCRFEVLKTTITPEGEKNEN